MTVVTGGGLVALGVFTAVKSDPTEGAAIIAAGLAVLGGKEYLGAAPRTV